MSEYYAVQRSSDYLAHYGVKGMKWGVRKAIKSGDAGKLAKQYHKASKKIQKLNNKADISRAKHEVKGHLNNAASMGVSGALLGGIGAGAMKFSGKKGVSGLQIGSAGLLGASAYHLARAAGAKYRTTAKGHQKAVEKRDSFKKQMYESFKGTKYSNLPGANKLPKKYDYEPFKTQMKDATKSAAIGAVTGQPGVGAKLVQAKKIANEHPSRKSNSKLNSRGLNPKQAALEKKWREASKREREALKERNKHLIDIGGKRQKAYKKAYDANLKAADNFFKSMNEKQMKRYHDKYLY